MSGGDRIAVFPSRGAQTLMKGRLKVRFMYLQCTLHSTDPQEGQAQGQIYVQCTLHSTDPQERQAKGQIYVQCTLLSTEPHEGQAQGQIYV